MLTFTLAISSFTISNLPWFMGLTFQVPMQYCSYSIGPCFYHQLHPQLGLVFALAPSLQSFFLELFLHWSPVAYWAPTDLGSPSFSVLSFCLFILFLGFSRQEYWSGLPFPSPVNHKMWSPPWPVHLGWPYMAWLIVSSSWTRLWSMWSDC